MNKTILITGATDGIGLEAARSLVADGHRVLIHGRSVSKLDNVFDELSATDGAEVERYLADLSNISEVDALADRINEAHRHIDVLINNAGVFRTSNPMTDSGIDVRFVVNTLAPYLLTKRLLPLMDTHGRIINLSSAAQSPVDLQMLTGKRQPGDEMSAYAQSKLAITMWTRQLAKSFDDGPVILAVNPGSLLGTKMVKEGFGMEGKDIHVGSDILIRAALADEFAAASGQYFDNDIGQIGPPHADALDDDKCAKMVEVIESALADMH